MPHIFRLHWKVRFSGGLAKLDMFSSVEKKASQWSKIVLIEPLSRLMQSAFVPFRKRRCRMMMSSPDTRKLPPFNPTPSPGAVCPAMVIFDAVIRISPLKVT
jgi:hypothetical protein